MFALPTKVLPKSVLDTVKRNRAVYAVGRRVRFAIGSRLGARPVPGLSSRAHFNDFMLTSTEPGYVRSYLAGARQFVGILERSLHEAGRDWESVEACLEVGCGYGRIVRELREKMPASRIHVTDVINEGARFTAAEFGAKHIPLLEHGGEAFSGKFDLIYLLSVYSHLRRDLVERNLWQACSALKSGGVLVFTTHGQGSAETCERYEQYWLDKPRLLAALAKDGYYYERYPYYFDEYGLTWFTKETIEALVAKIAPELEAVSHHPMDVDGHQDVFVYRKR